MHKNGIQGLILRNEVDHETMEREGCGHFETIVAFQAKVGEGAPVVEILAKAIREMTSVDNQFSPPMKMEIIPGSVTHTNAVRGCAIAESNVPISALRPNSSGKLYHMPTTSSTVAVLDQVQRGINTAKRFVLPGIEMFTRHSQRSEGRFGQSDLHC
jgi:hypothetical protein